MYQGYVARYTVVLCICIVCHFMSCTVVNATHAGITVRHNLPVREAASSGGVRQHGQSLYPVLPQYIDALKGDKGERAAKITHIENSRQQQELGAISTLLTAISQDSTVIDIHTYADLLTTRKELVGIFAPTLMQHFSTELKLEDIYYWTMRINTKDGGFWRSYATLAMYNNKYHGQDTNKERELHIRHVRFIGHWIETKLNKSDEMHLIRMRFISSAEIDSKIQYWLWHEQYEYAKFLASLLPDSMRFREMRLINSLLHGVSGSYAVAGSGIHSQRNLQLFILSKRILRGKKDERDEIRALTVFSRVACDVSNAGAYWKTAKHMIRIALRLEQYKTAYSIASTYTRVVSLDSLSQGQTSIRGNYVEASWLAGFILTEFLHRPRAAVPYFRSAYSAASLMTSKSQGAYWLGIAYKKSGDSNNAVKFLRIAKSHRGTFYSYIASHTLNSAVSRDELVSVAAHTPPTKYMDANIARAAFTAVILYRSGYVRYARMVTDYCAVFGLRYADAVLVTKYFINNKAETLAVRFVKMYGNHGYGVLTTGFPTSFDVLPSSRKGNPYLYFALMRQESEFDRMAYNIDGGFGLMQLMPKTAAEVARSINEDYKMYRHSHKHNVKYGVLYVDSLLTAFGSPMMAIAAYNAGGGSVRLWIKRYGDPREMRDVHSVVCWIEMIPFCTTRMHVKKVMENLWSYDVLYKGKYLTNITM